ncbi:LysR family transcriptional regulator [Kerstersia gyiorum]|uniref:LysR family transcriptional regulator n=1 Tax=Kerstersia gyiorum TaxID=206506 RepID=UPI0030D1FBA8
MRLISNIGMPNINDIDLNLLRVFDAIYRTRSVSRAALQLGLSQPSTSQALTRLRLLLRDPLFERISGGVRPTERANRLAQSVQSGLALLEAAVRDGESFDPASSTECLNLHLTDIGEARFLPSIMASLHRHAPGMRVEARTYPQASITEALDDGRLHFALGFLPEVSGTETQDFLVDRYRLLLRRNHPLCNVCHSPADWQERLPNLEFVAVRSHTETLRILQVLKLTHRVRLMASNFLALPGIMRNTDLAVIMPHEIARALSEYDHCAIIDPKLPLRHFNVALHWSRRHAHKPMLAWARHLLLNMELTPSNSARQHNGADAREP